MYREVEARRGNLLPVGTDPDLDRERVPDVDEDGEREAAFSM